MADNELRFLAKTWEDIKKKIEAGSRPEGEVERLTEELERTEQLIAAEPSTTRDDLQIKANILRREYLEPEPDDDNASILARSICHDVENN